MSGVLETIIKWIFAYTRLTEDHCGAPSRTCPELARADQHPGFHESLINSFTRSVYIPKERCLARFPLIEVKTVLGMFLWEGYFTQSLLEIHPYWSMWWQFVHFYSYSVVHCVNIPSTLFRYYTVENHLFAAHNVSIHHGELVHVCNTSSSISSLSPSPPFSSSFSPFPLCWRPILLFAVLLQTFLCRKGAASQLRLCILNLLQYCQIVFQSGCAS